MLWPGSRSPASRRKAQTSSRSRRMVPARSPPLAVPSRTAAGSGSTVVSSTPLVGSVTAPPGGGRRPVGGELDRGGPDQVAGRPADHELERARLGPPAAGALVPEREVAGPELDRGRRGGPWLERHLGEAPQLPKGALHPGLDVPHVE